MEISNHELKIIEDRLNDILRKADVIFHDTMILLRRKHDEEDERLIKEIRSNILDIQSIVFVLRDLLGLE